MRTRHFAFAFALGLMVAPASAKEGAWPVPADTSKARADRAMDRGRYEEALSAYRDAFALAPSPVLLYNMGRAEERLRHYAAALTMLRAFAAAAPPELKARVPRLEALMNDLRARVVELSIRSNVSGARVYIGEEPVGTTPFERPILVMPGVAALEVRAVGYARYTRQVTFDAGRGVVVDVALMPTGATETTASSRDLVTKQWWFWTGIGVVVLGGAAVTVAILTSHADPPGGNTNGGRVNAPLLRF